MRIYVYIYIYPKDPFHQKVAEQDRKVTNKSKNIKIDERFHHNFAENEAIINNFTKIRRARGKKITKTKLLATILQKNDEDETLFQKNDEHEAVFQKIDEFHFLTKCSPLLVLIAFAAQAQFEQ